MLMKFSWFVLLGILVVCQAIPLYNHNNDDDEDREPRSQVNSLNSDQLADLDEYFSRRLSEESFLDNLERNIRYSNRNSMMKRDALWTTTEVLDCVRRLKYSQNTSKLDMVTEMLNCYRRLKHHG